MRTVENSLLFFLSCMLLISCTGKRSDGTIVNNEVALQTEEIHFPQQDVLQLKSYYLSSPVHGDSVNILIGYNYRLHSLDYLDLESKQVTRQRSSCYISFVRHICTFIRFSVGI